MKGGMIMRFMIIILGLILVCAGFAYAVNISQEKLDSWDKLIIPDYVNYSFGSKTIRYDSNYMIIDFNANTFKRATAFVGGKWVTYYKSYEKPFSFKYQKASVIHCLNHFGRTTCKFYLNRMINDRIARLIGAEQNLVLKMKSVPVDWNGA